MSKEINLEHLTSDPDSLIDFREVDLTNIPNLQKYFETLSGETVLIQEFNTGMLEGTFQMKDSRTYILKSGIGNTEGYFKYIQRLWVGNPRD